MNLVALFLKTSKMYMYIQTFVPFCLDLVSNRQNIFKEHIEMQVKTIKRPVGFNLWFSLFFIQKMYSVFPKKLRDQLGPSD